MIYIIFSRRFLPPPLHRLLVTESKKMKKLTVVLLFYLMGWTALGQDLADTKLGDWLMYTGNVRLTDELKVQSVAHLRLYELSSNVQQVVALGFCESENESMGQFGGRLWIYPDGGF